MRTLRATTDWSAIEAAYRTGTQSVRDIADQHGITEGAIRKKAKASGWSRPAAAPKRPKKKAVIAMTIIPPRPPAPKRVSDPSDAVQRGRDLADRMLDELDSVTSRQGELEDMIDEATAGDESPRRRDAMMRAVSLPMRANTLKTIAQALKTLAETNAPEGKKAQRQAEAEEVGGLFAAPPPPGKGFAVN